MVEKQPPPSFFAPQPAATPLNSLLIVRLSSQWVPGYPFNHPNRPTGTSSIASWHYWHYAHRARCSAADMVDSCRGRPHRRPPLPAAHDEER